MSVGADRPFAERVALVTGASRGIGAAVALALADRGAYVYVNYRERAEAAAAVLEEIRRRGGQGAVVRASVADPAQVADMFALLRRESGRLDMLVNNAAILNDRLLGMMSDDDWRSVVDTNLNGVFYCTRQAVRMMIARRFGRIVNIGSVGGLTGPAGQSNYASTKAALLAFTRSLAFEVGAQNVRVNCVLPGVIETDMATAMPLERRRAMVDQTALKRIGRAAEVAEAVVFLLSEQASYVQGASLLVDGGLVHP